MPKICVLVWGVFLSLIKRFKHSFYHFWNGFGVIYSFIKDKIIEKYKNEENFFTYININNIPNFLESSGYPQLFRYPQNLNKFFNFIKHLSQEIFSLKTDSKCLNPTQDTFESVLK
jgi:hypothetical protein